MGRVQWTWRVDQNLDLIVAGTRPKPSPVHSMEQDTRPPPLLCVNTRRPCALASRTISGSPRSPDSHPRVRRALITRASERNLIDDPIHAVRQLSMTITSGTQKSIQVVCESSLQGNVRTNHVRATIGAQIFPLWWRFSGELTPREPASSNHALTALLPFAMHQQADLHIHGAVDQTLLENLEESVDAWTMWRPDLYRRIQISADQALTVTPDLSAGAALMYSGGVDANYALVAHKEALLGHRSREIRTAVLVQGFDIPLLDERWFSVARQHARPILDYFSCPLTEVQTNWRSICVDWEMEHGFAIASVLHQLDSSYGAGLWAADEPYNREVIPWGSNSISNPLLSGGGFPIRCVGAGINRSAKTGVIGKIRCISDHLRVCWRHPDNGLNCGTCEKCVRTRLALQAHGIHNTLAFGGDVGPELVANIVLANRIQFELLQEVLHIPESQLPQPLKTALRARLARFEREQQRHSFSWRSLLGRTRR